MKTKITFREVDESSICTTLSGEDITSNKPIKFKEDREVIVEIPCKNFVRPSSQSDIEWFKTAPCAKCGVEKNEHHLTAVERAKLFL